MKSINNYDVIVYFIVLLIVGHIRYSYHTVITFMKKNKYVHHFVRTQDKQSRKITNNKIKLHPFLFLILPQPLQLSSLQ